VVNFSFTYQKWEDSKRDPHNFMLQIYF